jgi:hypothetical protein
MPHRGKKAALRPKHQMATRTQPSDEVGESPFKSMSTMKLLQHGLASSMHRKFGWLTNLLLAQGNFLSLALTLTLSLTPNLNLILSLGIFNNSKDEVKARVGIDYANQISYIEGVRAVRGEDEAFNPQFVDVRGKDGKFVRHTKNKISVPKNPTTVQYLIWAYGVSYPTFKRWKKEDFKSMNYVPLHAGKTVIDNPEYAMTVYTPQRMYINEQMTTWYENQRTHSRRVDAAAKKNQRLVIKRAWTHLLEEDKVVYEKMARDHQARQPFIKECLVDALQKKKGG